jgi:hypothetical protein
MPDPATTTTLSPAVSWLWGALTVVLGFVVKSVSDWIEHKRTLEREQETRSALRRDHLAERRVTFQRQTLLELQEAVQDLARSTGESHVQDERAYKETGKWQKQLLGEELAEKLLVANRRVLLLAVRVRDETLRNTVNEFRKLTTELETFDRKVPDAQLREASFAALKEAVPVLEQFHERVGEILRTLDDDESALKNL